MNLVVWDLLALTFCSVLVLGGTSQLASSVRKLVHIRHERKLAKLNLMREVENFRSSFGVRTDQGQTKP